MKLIQQIYYAWQIFVIDQERLEEFLTEIEEEIEKRNKLIENWKKINEEERYLELLFLYDAFEKEETIDYYHSKRKRPETMEELEEEIIKLRERFNSIKSKLNDLYLKTLSIFKKISNTNLASNYMELLMYDRLWKTEEKNEKIWEILDIERNCSSSLLKKSGFINTLRKEDVDTFDEPFQNYANFREIYKWVEIVWDYLEKTPDKDVFWERRKKIHRRLRFMNMETCWNI